MTPSQPRVVPSAYSPGCIVDMVLLDLSIPIMRPLDGTIRWGRVLPFPRASIECSPSNGQRRHTGCWRDGLLRARSC